MIRDTGEQIADAIRRLHAASAGMVTLRVLLAVACLACIRLPGVLPSFWYGVLVVLGAATVLWPDSLAGTGFLLAVLATWVATGHHLSPVLVAEVVCLAVVHWLTTLCARGPLQAVVRPGALSGRAWTRWAGASAVACGVVWGVGQVPASMIPRGAVWVIVALIVSGTATLTVALRSH